VPVGVAIVLALDAFMYGAVGTRCGCAVLQERHAAHIVVSAVVSPTMLALLYGSSFVVQQEVIRVREAGRVVVLSTRKIVLQFGSEASIASFGGGYSVCLVLLLRGGIGLCPHPFSDGVEIWPFGSNSGAIVL
jgi:hypothetical protein